MKAFDKRKFTACNNCSQEFANFKAFTIAPKGGFDTSR